MTSSGRVPLRSSLLDNEYTVPENFFPDTLTGQTYRGKPFTVTNGHRRDKAYISTPDTVELKTPLTSLVAAGLSSVILGSGVGVSVASVVFALLIMVSSAPLFLSIFAGLTVGLWFVRQFYIRFRKRVVVMPEIPGGRNWQLAQVFLALSHRPDLWGTSTAVKYQEAVRMFRDLSDGQSKDTYDVLLDDLKKDLGLRV